MEVKHKRSRTDRFLLAVAAQLVSNYCFAEGELRAPHADVTADGTNHVSWYQLNRDQKTTTRVGYDLSPAEVRSMWESVIAQELSESEMQELLEACAPENKMLQGALHKLRQRALAGRAAAALRAAQADMPQDRATAAFAEIMEDESRRHRLTREEQGALDALNAIPAAASALKKLGTAVPARMEKMILNDKREGPVAPRQPQEIREPLKH